MSKFFVECSVLSVGPFTYVEATEKAERFDRLSRNTVCHEKGHRVVPEKDARGARDG